mmetsp:Transcript_62790/g.180620  ORF Transcript_62790/g.180620 Transcript_62790/m.180620 type:complete len:220 (-) Transcript_62790:230-889(-)
MSRSSSSMTTSSGHTPMTGHCASRTGTATYSSWRPAAAGASSQFPWRSMISSLRPPRRQAARGGLQWMARTCRTPASSSAIAVRAAGAAAVCTTFLAPRLASPACGRWRRPVPGLALQVRLGRAALRARPPRRRSPQRHCRPARMRPPCRGLVPRCWEALPVIRRRHGRWCRRTVALRCRDAPGRCRHPAPGGRSSMPRLAQSWARSSIRGRSARSWSS